MTVPGVGRQQPVGPITVGPIANGGHCVARHQGRVIFVRHALPGEVVMISYTDTSQPRFWRADAVKIITASPDRVEPPCPVAGPGLCGGCDFQHASLAAQRRLKAAVVAEQLDRLAGIDWQGVVEEVSIAEGHDGLRWRGGLHWRTRMRYQVDRSAPGSPIIGLRAHRSRQVIPLPDQGCLIADPRIANPGPPSLAPRWPGSPAGGSSSSARLSSSLARGSSLSRPGDDLDQLDQRAGESVDQRAGESVDQRAGEGELVAVAADPATFLLDGELIQGSRELTEHAVNRDWKVNAEGFWQVHPAAADTLAQAVLDGLEPVAGERAFDLYCGVGLFAGALTDRGCVVWGVESSARAIALARRNVSRPADHAAKGPPWSRQARPTAGPPRFTAGRVDRVLRQLPKRTDLVVLDPPRAGARRQVMRAVIDRRPRRIAYVACDPAALARDLQVAQTLGYQVISIRAFDLFPMTQHVECVAILAPAGHLQVLDEEQSDILTSREFVEPNQPPGSDHP